MRPPTLILTGPTASGKTALAVELAARHPYELVSADSMQVYRGMAIGTAQPSPEELKGAALHGCGVLDPREPFSVKRFLDLCDEARAGIEARGRTALYVGGTGMYLRALRWGLFDEPEVAADALAEIRARIEAEMREIGPEALHARLREIDPALAEKITPRDRVRIVRGLEVAEATGRQLSGLQSQWPAAEPRFPHRLVVLDVPREILVERIERRVEEMLDTGWIDEVRRLLDAGVAPEQHCFKALGYREIIAHLEGRLDRTAMVEVIKAKTRQFSKRQMTWMRREREAVWIAHDPRTPGATLREIERLFAPA